MPGLELSEFLADERDGERGDGEQDRGNNLPLEAPAK